MWVSSADEVLIRLLCLQSALQAALNSLDVRYFVVLKDSI
jgi:hypothetical protein